MSYRRLIYLAAVAAVLALAGFYTGSAGAAPGCGPTAVPGVVIACPPPCGPTAVPSIVYPCPVAPAVAPQPADSYLWCNEQDEWAPFTLSLTESLTLDPNWYRPVLVAGTPTCATAGVALSGAYADSNGNGVYDEVQHQADLSYWHVSSLYAVAS